MALIGFRTVTLADQNCFTLTCIYTKHVENKIKSKKKESSYQNVCPFGLSINVDDETFTF